MLKRASDWLIVIKIKVRSIIGALATNIINTFQDAKQHNQLLITFDYEELHSPKDDLSALKEVSNSHLVVYDYLEEEKEEE